MLDDLSVIPETAPLVDNVTFIYIPVANSAQSCNVFKYAKKHDLKFCLSSMLSTSIERTTAQVIALVPPLGRTITHAQSSEILHSTSRSQVYLASKGQLQILQPC